MKKDTKLTKLTKDPVCLQGKRDCNRNRDGFCVLLRDTEFKKPCPSTNRRKKAKRHEKKALRGGAGLFRLGMNKR